MSKGNKSIKSAVNKALIFGIVSAILFVVGIPLIVMGASNQVWAVLVFGIVFVVFGFYGSPMIWINYANLRSMKRVVDAVNEEHLLSNEDRLLIRWYNTLSKRKNSPQKESSYCKQMCKLRWFAYGNRNWLDL